MRKFLASCQYNEEEFSQHLKKKCRILAGPNEWQQVCNRSTPEKTGRSCGGADFSWWSSKVSRTLLPSTYRAKASDSRRGEAAAEGPDSESLKFSLAARSPKPTRVSRPFGLQAGWVQVFFQLPKIGV
jgi:hypothetical protein